jgi:hypothetical protein
MNRRLIIVFAAMLALLLPTSMLAAPATQTDTVQPPAGPVGTRFVFITSGFKPNERLSAWMNAPDGSVVSDRAGVPERALSDGSVTWNWVAPDSSRTGFWQIVVHGLASGTERVLTFQITAPEQPAQTTAYNITPAVGSAGTIFRFYATGFTPGERVDTYALTPNQVEFRDNFIIRGSPGTDGRLDGSWTAPLNVPSYGTWQIVMSGRTSGVKQTIPFQIEQTTAPTATPLQVSPDRGMRGMRFLFYTSGFKPKEVISTWLNAPDGSVVPLNDLNVKAASDGRANWQWVAPFDVQFGTWSMVAHGRESGIEQIVKFEIIPGIQ